MAKKVTKAAKATKAMTMPLVPRTEIGFPPFVGNNPEILILGEFPGTNSLATRQICNHCYLIGSPCTNHPCTGRYYEDYRNLFRDIIANIYNGNSLFKTYDEFLICLDTNHIALWDVYSSRTYLGKILLNQTLNDLDTFLNDHPSIQKIVFNGSEAEKVFHEMQIPFTGQLIRAKSTSGRNSNLNKLADWQNALRPKFKQVNRKNRCSY